MSLRGAERDVAIRSPSPKKIGAFVNAPYNKITLISQPSADSFPLLLKGEAFVIFNHSDKQYKKDLHQKRHRSFMFLLLREQP